MSRLRPRLWTVEVEDGVGIFCYEQFAYVSYFSFSSMLTTWGSLFVGFVHRHRDTLFLSKKTDRKNLICFSIFLFRS